MSEEDLKIWFLDKFNSCYPVVPINDRSNIFWYYDESYVRKKKLYKINNQELTLPTIVSGVCLFNINLSEKALYCNPTKIWNFFEYNYSTNNERIQSLINSWLTENNKLNTIDPSWVMLIRGKQFNDSGRLRIYLQSNYIPFYL